MSHEDVGQVFLALQAELKLCPTCTYKDFSDEKENK